MATATATRATKLNGIAPQFLVDGLHAAIAFYQEKLGFDLDFYYDSFYASVSRDGCAIHLKCAPKTIADRTNRKQHEHLDAFIGVIDAAGLHDERGRAERESQSPWATDRGHAEISTSRIPTDTFSASASRSPDQPLVARPHARENLKRLRAKAR